MSTVPDTCVWRRHELGQAFDALVRRSGLPSVDLPAAAAPSATDESDVDRRAVETWLAESAELRGLHVEVFDVDAESKDEVLRRGGPALLVTNAEPSREARIIVLLRAGARRVRLLARDGRIVDVKRRGLTLDAFEVTAPPWASRIAEATGAPETAVSGAIAAADSRIARPAAATGYALVPGGWAPIRDQIKAAGLGRQALFVVAASLLDSAIGVGALAIFGAAALAGRLRPADLVGWALLFFARVPLNLFAERAQVKVSLGVSVILRRRLLEGVLRLKLDRLRDRGASALLALVNEAETFERLALQVGFGTVATVANVLGVLTFLFYGQAVAPLLGLAAALGVAMALVARYWYAALRKFTELRLCLADDLAAKMVGHRTRLAQKPRAAWHEGEDSMLASQIQAGRATDRWEIVLQALPRVWSVVSMLILVPTFLTGSVSATFTVTVAATLLFAGAIQGIVSAIFETGRLFTSWQTIGEVIRAGSATAPRVSAKVPASDESAGADAPFIDLVKVGYAYGNGQHPVLEDASFRLRPGERVFVEGPSGGGKSTFASILAGLRLPTSGLAFVGGLDQFTQTPARFRRQVAVSPQFHENHVFLNTLRFNLLLGRAWPPSEKDIELAGAICRELGLGPLLDRMPSHLFEIVGESGWQLSHGEQSRLFIARALLQDTELVVIDEGFAALDPETLRQCLDCVFRRARTLVVVAHP